MVNTKSRATIAVTLAITFIVLNVVDILLTWQGLKLGAIELNFLMDMVLERGFLSSIAFKLGIASGIAAIMLHKGQFAMLIVGVSLLSFVCVRNLAVIGQLS
jgi:hypothetical protein